MRCHQCDEETDFTCDRCGEPVCESCCVQMTYHNQIDYPLCTTCYSGIEAERSNQYHKEEMDLLHKEEKRKARNAKARANYNKPENVEKRNKKRIENKKKKDELIRKQREEALKIIGSILKI